MKTVVWKEKLARNSGCETLVTVFPDARSHFMHIVPEAHFGFCILGAICSRAFIFLGSIWNFEAWL